MEPGLLQVKSRCLFPELDSPFPAILFWRIHNRNVALTNDGTKQIDTIAIMNLKNFWGRHRAQRWPLSAAGPIKASPPKPFQPLTRDESLAVVTAATDWFTEEVRAMHAMPNGPSREHRRAELRARHQSLVRDYQRLLRGHNN
ncbi:MAG: hypothetical protein C5B50_22360 [Verrucomicrobia bacterium]|nr:MAG: hypothetical protein C5B50_22360 [Verrucomicrobiota bacterium]